MLTIHLVAENSVYDSMLALVQEDGPTSMYSLEVSSFMSFIVSYKKTQFPRIPALRVYLAVHFAPWWVSIVSNWFGRSLYEMTTFEYMVNFAK